MGHMDEISWEITWNNRNTGAIGQPRGFLTPPPPLHVWLSVSAIPQFPITPPHLPLIRNIPNHQSMIKVITEAWEK
jgi:hypothetical protein